MAERASRSRRPPRWYGTDEVRVSEVTDINICVEPDLVGPSNVIELYVGCGPVCAAVFTPAFGPGSTATARVRWTADGVPGCVGGTFPVPVDGLRTCLVSVGTSAQHQVGACLVVLSEDP